MRIDDFIDEILTQHEAIQPPLEVAKLPFGEALWPWIIPVRKRVKKSYALSDAAFFSLEKALLKRLSSLFAPAFTLEMGICKYAKALKGKTRRRRYKHFVETKLQIAHLNAFFDEYSELKKKAAVVLDLWISQATEFQLRLENDLMELATYFNFGKPLGPVTEINPSISDPHNGGRSVYLLTFGSGLKLLYKPKSLQIVKAFHSIFDHLNKLGLQPKLKGYKVLSKEDYGWEEYVENTDCAAVKCYYERAGALLCLLYLLDGTDIHYENIIASGEHPQLIDMETIFHARIKKDDTERFVLNTGLLPFYIMGAMGRKGVDISGLGGQAGQKYPTASAKWQHCNTDEMHLIHVRGKVKDAKNCVKVAGKKIQAKKYVSEIVSGFRKTYDLIALNRASFLEAIAPLQKCPVRFVMRPTRLYFHILQRIRDPQVLLHGELLQEEFSSLTVENESLNNIVEEEKRALLQGDIPFFRTFPNETHLYSSEGRCIVKGVLVESAFQKACQRIEKMNEQDCCLQEQLIRQSFFVKKGDRSKKEIFLRNASKKSSLSISEDNLWNKIYEIAGDLKKNSFVNTGDVLNWIDIELDPVVEQYQLQPITDNFYGGKSGIALFFAALTRVSGKPEWKKLAYTTIGEARNKIQQGQGSKLVNNLGIGGYAGVGGIAYALYQMGKLLEDRELIVESKRLLKCITKKQIFQDEMFDLIGGSAGLILSIVAQNDPALMPLAMLCADHLCEKAINVQGGIGWGREENVPLLGFSHGSAGIAYALQKVATFNCRYLEKATQALEYERSHFNVKEQNWPHLDAKVRERYLARWCHGATGIGFGRIASPIHDAYREKEIESALLTTKKKMFEGANPTLCCTQLGRFEFLLESSIVLNDKTIKEEAMRLFPAIFSFLKKRGSKDYLSPGIMQGQAGVGYTLLRLIDPTLPQVLLLG